MNDFEKHFVCDKPMTYYITLGFKEGGLNWLIVDSIITKRPVYAQAGVVAVFSEINNRSR